MFHEAVANFPKHACDHAAPVLDWVITSRRASPPAQSLALFFGGCSVLAGLDAVRRVGLGEQGSTPMAIAIVVFAALHFFMRRPGYVCERIVIKGGAMRIAHYQSGELVEQRRFKLTGVAVEYRADSDAACSFLALRINGRARRPRRIEIARDLTPSERAGFLRDFLQALRSIGANPPIFDHEGHPLALNDGLPSQCIESPRCPSPWRRDSILSATSGPAR